MSLFKKHIALPSVDKRLNKIKERERAKDNRAFLPWATKREMLVLTKIKKKKVEEE